MHDIKITIGAIRRVERLCDGVSLFDVITETTSGQMNLLGRLATDHALLVDVCYAILKPDLDAASVDDLAFGEQLDGEAFASLRRQFFDELTAFFEAGGRSDQATAIRRLMQTETRAIEQTRIAIEAIPADQALSTPPTFGTSFTNSPEPVASTPTP